MRVCFFFKVFFTNVERKQLRHFFIHDVELQWQNTAEELNLLLTMFG